MHQCSLWCWKELDWRPLWSVCGSLLCDCDWLMGAMSHYRVTYGCNLALITYTISLTLIRLSLRWVVTDAGGGGDGCSGVSDGRMCWHWQEVPAQWNRSPEGDTAAIKATCSKKTSWVFTQRGTESHQPSAAPVSGNESPPGLQPWPRGRPFMDDHFISKQSAERLQTKDAQSPKVTLPRQPWRQIGRLEQRIIPEIETLKHSAQLALVQIPSRHTLPLPVNCWLKVQLKTISMFKCCDPSRETSYLMNSSTWQALRVPVN